ncbi:unnamed protein product, partial [Cylicostephanus goldi]
LLPKYATAYYVILSGTVHPNLGVSEEQYRTNIKIFTFRWHFAYNSILEEKVRRRRNNWSWPRMQAHRKLLREYRDAWVKVLTEKSPGSDVDEIVKRAEEKLDVFNVNIARQQAEMDVDRQGLKRVEDQPQGWLAWGKSWFGGGEEKPHAEKKKDFADQFNEAMTPEEKAKLFEAIDYQENIPPTNYPKEFVENKFDFRLGQVCIPLSMKICLCRLLSYASIITFVDLYHVFSLKSTIQELRMDGCGAEMLRVRDPSKPWLYLCVDTNPLHGKYDQSVELAIAPVNLKYHAPAVNNAIDVRLRVSSLQTSGVSEVKARSVTGLAHAVENRSRLVLDIQIQPATIYISEGGVYDSNKPTLLADLGLLSITTIESDPVSLTILKNCCNFFSARNWENEVIHVFSKQCWDALAMTVVYYTISEARLSIFSFLNSWLKRKTEFLAVAQEKFG